MEAPGHVPSVPSPKSGTAFVYVHHILPLSTSMDYITRKDMHFPAGTENPWTTWKALNRLRTQVGRSKVNMSKLGY